jgi:hypothetical protein
MAGVLAAASASPTRVPPPATARPLPETASLPRLKRAGRGRRPRLAKRAAGTSPSFRTNQLRRRRESACAPGRLIFRNLRPAARCSDVALLRLPDARTP